MISINISTKNGILLFSHFFVQSFYDADVALRAGLITKVLSAIKKTHYDMELRTIKQGNYFLRKKLINNIV
ncbi:MAG: hypothetical protein ACFFB2_12620 [Promethearchaeota archaeon]